MRLPRHSLPALAARDITSGGGAVVFHPSGEKSAPSEASRKIRGLINEDVVVFVVTWEPTELWDLELRPL